MKTRIKFLIGALMLSLCSFSQIKDSVHIVKLVDEMDDKVYLVPSHRLVISNDEQTIGIIIDVFINENFTFSTLYAKMVGIGGCNEKDEIIILLEDGEKIKKTSWKKFNCDGETYFSLTKTDIEKLQSSPIDKVRMTNGRTFDSFTHEPLPEQKRWFIQIFYAMQNKLATEQ